jgi:hypothetical protein
MPQQQHPAPLGDRRRNVRRTTILLVLVVLGIYVAFIASGVLKAH